MNKQQTITAQRVLIDITEDYEDNWDDSAYESANNK